MAPLLWQCRQVQRLRSRAQFQAVLAGRVLARTPHFVLHQARLRANASPTAEAKAAPARAALFAVDDVWLGAMVPKRWARRAVTRNTIKRQIYAVGLSGESRMTRAAHLVRLRAEFARAQFVSATSTALRKAVRAELDTLFAQAAHPSMPAAASRPPTTQEPRP